MSFFDDDDEPTRVRRAAAPRRPSTASRPAAGAPDRQAVRTRQAIALGLGVLVLVLLVVGVRGCLDSRKENGLKDYNRNVTAVVRDSDTQVGRPLFALLSQGGEPQDLQVQLNQLRSAADEDVRRAKALDVPGDMAAAQRNLELVLNLRAEGLRRIADQIPSALGDGQAAEQAYRAIAAEMQSFLASDVVYARRVRPLISDALTGADISGQQIASSRFTQSVEWLSPTVVQNKLGAGSDTSTSGAAAPGLHGHGLTSVAIGDVTLSADSQANQVPAASNPVVVVKFANQGDNDERNVKLNLRLSASGAKTITQTKTVAQTKSKTDIEESIRLDSTPPVAVATKLTISISRVRGEQKVENNRAEYTVVFTR